MPGLAHPPPSPSSPLARALDLVAIGFAKPARFYGHTITNREELMSVSAAFKVGPQAGRQLLPGVQLCAVQPQQLQHLMAQLYGVQGA